MADTDADVVVVEVSASPLESYNGAMVIDKLWPNVKWVVFHPRMMLSRSRLWRWMNSFRQQWCIWRDLENESVFLTKRESRCLRVLIHLSTWQVSPCSLPVASCWSWGITSR